jgi:hypothetical protein
MPDERRPAGVTRGERQGGGEIGPGAVAGDGDAGGVDAQRLSLAQIGRASCRERVS